MYSNYQYNAGVCMPYNVRAYRKYNVQLLPYFYLNIFTNYFSYSDIYCISFVTDIRSPALTSVTTTSDRAHVCSLKTTYGGHIRASYVGKCTSNWPEVEGLSQELRFLSYLNSCHHRKSKSEHAFSNP